ncbi:hypothetical protein K474DRAFT_398330 [Panus rudis PR-1116 ss-1]|nr:hypothetical protein K474DRAFT_398330 [Panus rudis PR-1116 ss-1]
MLFNTKLASLALVAAAALSVSAQDSSAPAATPSLSTCILGCLTQASSGSSCQSFTDVSCVCSDQTFQQNAAQCLESQCSSDEQQAAIQLQQQECGGTASSAAPTGSSAASSAISAASSAISSIASGASSLASSLSSRASSAASSATRPASSGASATGSGTSSGSSSGAVSLISHGGLAGVGMAVLGMAAGAAFIL